MRDASRVSSWCEYEDFDRLDRWLGVVGVVLCGLCFGLRFHSQMRCVKTKLVLGRKREPAEREASAKKKLTLH